MKQRSKFGALSEGMYVLSDFRDLHCHTKQNVQTFHFLQFLQPLRFNIDLYFGFLGRQADELIIWLYVDPLVLTWVQ